MDSSKKPYEKYFVEIRKTEGLDDDCDIGNILPAHLGAFILSNIKRILNIFLREINDFYTISIYYGDTDSLYIEKKYWCVRQS